MLVLLLPPCFIFYYLSVITASAFYFPHFASVIMLLSFFFLPFVHLEGLPFFSLSLVVPASFPILMIKSVLLYYIKTRCQIVYPDKSSHFSDAPSPP